MLGINAILRYSRRGAWQAQKIQWSTLQTSAASAVPAFFEQYRPDGFSFNNQVALRDELARLGAELKFDKNTRRSSRRALGNAFAEQFRLARGDGPKSVLSWQNLLKRFKMPTHDTVERCKEVVWALSYAEVIERANKRSSHQSGRTEKPFIRAFFLPYSSQGFCYDPEVSAIDEFHRLCRELRFTKKMRDKARDELRRAYVNQFNANYGTDVNNIHAWQDLCKDCELSVYDTLEECQLAVKNANINLVDLIDFIRPLEHFPTEEKLSRYSRGTRRILSRADVALGGLLKTLLRRIFHPRTGPGRRQGCRGTVG